MFYKVLSWIFIIIGALFVLLGIIGSRTAMGYILVTPRGCVLLAQAFLLFALNFAVFRFIQLKEGGK